ncbi:MAG: hypothetical protein AABW85_03125 [archaeon]
MIAIKAAIYIAMIFALTAIIAGAFLAAGTRLELSLEELRAKMDAAECAQIINSFYANSGGKIKNFDASCRISEEQTVLAIFGSAEKSEFILNTNSKTTAEKSSFKIEVKARGHYENQ